MKIEEVRALKSDELHNHLAELRRKLFDLRSQSVTEKLEDPSQLVKARRTVARILTVLRERNEVNVEQRQAHLTATSARR